MRNREVSTKPGTTRRTEIRSWNNPMVMKRSSHSIDDHMRGGVIGGGRDHGLNSMQNESAIRSGARPGIDEAADRTRISNAFWTRKSADWKRS